MDYAELVNGESVSYTRFELCDGLLFVNIPYDDFSTITYILEDEIDWEYIRSLLNFDAVNPDPEPDLPNMTVSGISSNASASGVVEGPLYAARKVVIVADDKGTWVAEYSKDKTVLRLQEPGDESESTHYLYDVGEGIGGFFGVEMDRVQLGFSYAPADYTVLVESWDRSESYTLSSAELENNVLPLAPYSAHYTVCGGFDTVRNTHYEMEFYFDIGLLVDADIWELR